MSARRDYYAVLGVASDASADELKLAYRRLAQRYHPDKARDEPGAEENFKEAAEAYGVLGDPEKRARYDQVRAFRQGPFGAAFGDIPLDDFDPEKLKSAFGDWLGGLFGGGASGGPSGGPSGGKRDGGGPRGADLKYRLRVGFLEAARGCKRRVTYMRLGPCAACAGSGARRGSALGSEPCRACGGAGSVSFQGGPVQAQKRCTACGGTGKRAIERCEKCRGDGRERGETAREVTVPAGIVDGARLRVAGAGDCGPAGTPGGDLFVELEVAAHPLFARDGTDVRCEVPIPFAVAALGGDVEVPTIDGLVSMRVPAGTPHGATLRLRGRGLPRVDWRAAPAGAEAVSQAAKAAPRGDAYVKVTLEVPSGLDAAQREALEAFVRAGGADAASPRVREFRDQARELCAPDDVKETA